MEAIKNKKAYFDYEILDTLEVGISLLGSEVKSIKSGQMQLGDSYVKIENGKMVLWNASIPLFKYSQDKNYKADRTRPLLAHKSEIYRLESKVKQGNLTLIPLRVYSTRGKVKLEIGLAKGRKIYDKKLREKERDLTRELHREKRELVV